MTAANDRDPELCAWSTLGAQRRVGEWRRCTMKAMVAKRVAALAMFVLVPAAVASAQYRAGIQGAVTDPSGARIPDATVTLVNQETGLSRTTVTSASGVYSIAGLVPGQYIVTVEKEGFAAEVLENVGVRAEVMHTVDVALEVGGAQDTVTVSAEAVSLVDTSGGTVGGTITTRQVESLPSYGRDPLRLALLTPGSFGNNARASGGGSENLPGNAGPGGTGSDSIFKTENQVQVSAGGRRTTSNSITIDGVAVNALNWGGASVITPNTESIREIRVETSSYSAEHARAGGAQIQVVSKHGTNDWHGSLFARYADPELNSFQEWNGPVTDTARVPDRVKQFGGSVGGPVVRNKLFFFFSYERQPRTAIETGDGWYETPQFTEMLQAEKPNSLAARIAGHPGMGATFSSVAQGADCAFANVSPCAEIVDGGGNLLGLDIGSPLDAPLGTQDPTAAGDGLDGVPDVMFVNTLSTTDQRAQQFNGRVDFQATVRDLVAFSTYQTPVYTESVPVRSANAWITDRLNHAETLLWNRTLSSRFVNEARLTASRWSWDEIDSNPQVPWGLPPINIDARGNADVTDLGAPGPGVFAQTTYNFRNILSWAHGSHFTKFGADIYWEQNNASRQWGARPTFVFHNVWDFANDAPYQENGNFDPRTGEPTGVLKYMRSGIVGFFVQDDWRIRPNLTLNLGLRWEYFDPLSEKNDEISNAVLGTGPNTLTDLRMRLGSNLFNASQNNWAPQAGFAWTPFPDNSRLVVRGGFGVGFTRSMGAVLMDMAANAPFLSTVNLQGDDILYEIPEDVSQFGEWPINPATVLDIDPETNLPTAGSQAVQIIEEDLATPTTYRYSLEAQYDLGARWVASVGYQGSQTRNYTRRYNLNWFFPDNLNPALTNVGYTTNDGDASYNAMLLGLKRRFSGSFEIDAQYALSSARDTGSHEYGDRISQYPFDQSYLRGPSDYDVRHNVKLYGVWSPQFFQVDSAMERLLGGWQVSGILNWHSGFPWTPQYDVPGGGIIYPADGYSSLWPAAYLGGAGSDSSNETFMGTNGNFPGGAYEYFTVSPFERGTIPPPPGVERNSFRGPHYLGFDMTFQKSFGLPTMQVLGNRARLEIRADIFNVFNELNLSQVANVIGDNPTTPNPNFGQSQSAFAGRVINFQARFSF
ncbi:MAG: carboxypeptidase regulatory-like domain-containing protein [Luteitalea sp.]|nr:carboxypeptidase regulatory-like domain-containing protein [Luteitalea sp.]